MIKFKNGDTVKCTKYKSEGDSHLYQIDKEYEVLGRGILKDGVLIKEETHICTPSQDYFVLIRAKELSEIEKEFYRLYAIYETLYLTCHPERVHPYQQTDYFEQPKQIKEDAVELLRLKIGELHEQLKHKENEIKISSKKEQLISLFKHWIDRKIISDKIDRLKKVYSDENRKYYIAINYFADDYNKPKVVYEIYRGITDERSDIIDETIMLSQIEYNELNKLFVSKFVSKSKDERQVQFADFPIE